MKITKLFTILCALLVCLVSANAFASNNPNENKEEYITIGEMAEGFSEYNLPQTTDLAGKEYTIYMGEPGAQVAVLHRFVNDKVVYWKVLDGPEKGVDGYDEYIATNPKKGYYYVEFITGSNHAKMVTLAMDMKRQIATVVLGFFPKEKDDQKSMYTRSANKQSIMASSVEIMNASINKPMTKRTPRHELNSSDLVGQRRLYQYSSKDAYEHIYHQNRLFTWSCYSGNEKGLADTDFAQIVKFEEDFYMIVWVEKIMHIVSTITLNFDSMRSSGAMASFEGWDYGEMVNVSSGAIITNLPGVKASDYKMKK